MTLCHACHVHTPANQRGWLLIPQGTDLQGARTHNSGCAFAGLLNPPCKHTARIWRSCGPSAAAQWHTRAGSAAPACPGHAAGVASCSAELACCGPRGRYVAVMVPHIAPVAFAAHHSCAHACARRSRHCLHAHAGEDTVPVVLGELPKGTRLQSVATSLQNNQRTHRRKRRRKSQRGQARGAPSWGRHDLSASPMLPARPAASPYDALLPHLSKSSKG